MIRKYEVHYHEHAEYCKVCSQSRDKQSIESLVEGGHESFNQLYNDSCEDGKNILLEFWLNYSDEEYGI